VIAEGDHNAILLDPFSAQAPHWHRAKAADSLLGNELLSNYIESGIVVGTLFFPSFPADRFSLETSGRLR